MADYPDKIDLEIVTPEKLVLSRKVDDVTLPSVEGYMGVLPGHAPLLARLEAGEVSYLDGGERRYLAVSGGYAEVLRGAVSVLARTSEPAEEIDVARAERARDAAESLLSGNDPTAHTQRRAEVRLKRALSRIRVSQRLDS
jgi:F-type H+-transporting ATPase subunit epsilon